MRFSQSLTPPESIWKCEAMANHTIEVAGIPDELMRLLEARVRETGGDRDAFIREVLVKELQDRQEPDRSAKPHADLTFQEILRPVHRQVAESGTTDEELDEIFEEALEQVRNERRAARKPQ
jgi:hypothetical protein